MPSRILAVQSTAFPNGQTIAHRNGMAKLPVRSLREEMKQAARDQINPDLIRQQLLVHLNRFKS